jgi:hypothetical protein
MHRFDDAEPGRAGAFGTCYAASSIEVAFAESVVHEFGRFVGASYEVPAADYTTSQALAQAIHGPSSRWDGIRYVSRHMNKGFAYAIFQRSGHF